MDNEVKQGRLRRSWELTKSSWTVFTLDKELAAIPLLSVLMSILALIVFAAISTAVGLQMGALSIHSGTTSAQIPRWLTAAGTLVAYFVLTLISNYYSAALIYGATQRFNGEDPTVRSSLAGARHKFYPLAMFSLMMASIGLIFRTLEERIPFAGKIAVWILDAAWSVANVFAVPVIVLSETNIAPLDATKQSVKIIKKVWGESVIVNTGIGIIGLFAIVCYWVVAMLLGALGSAMHIPLGVGILAAVIGILGLLALIFILTALSAIAKAALYHYAITGEAPASFNKNLLHASISPKKARRIFG